MVAIEAPRPPEGALDETFQGQDMSIHVTEISMVKETAPPAQQVAQNDSNERNTSCPQVQEHLITLTDSNFAKSLSGPNFDLPSLDSLPPPATRQFSLVPAQTASMTASTFKPIRDSRSTSSYSGVESDPMVSRMKRILNEAYASTPGSPSARSLTQSQKALNDVEDIVRVANMCFKGTGYVEENFDHSKSKKMGLGNIRTLDMLAAKAAESAQASSSKLVPRSQPTTSEELINNYLHMRYLLSNGGGRYLPHRRK